jgi:hypothetical protein
LADNEEFPIGTGDDYWFKYATAGAQYEFWTTNADGGGTDGLIFKVDDGTDDVDFTGIINTAGLNSVASTGVRGIYATSTNLEAVYGSSTLSTGVRGHSTNATGVDGHSTKQFSGYFHRASDAATTTGEVVRIVQSHLADDQDALTVHNYGSGNILTLLDGASTVVSFKDGGDTDYTGIVKAGGYKSSDGTAGMTGELSIGGGTLSVKNGLITAWTP